MHKVPDPTHIKLSTYGTFMSHTNSTYNHNLKFWIIGDLNSYLLNHRNIPFAGLSYLLLAKLSPSRKLRTLISHFKDVCLKPVVVNATEKLI